MFIATTKEKNQFLEIEMIHNLFVDQAIPSFFFAKVYDRFSFKILETVACLDAPQCWRPTKKYPIYELLQWSAKSIQMEIFNSPFHPNQLFYQKLLNTFNDDNDKDDNYVTAYASLFFDFEKFEKKASKKIFDSFDFLRKNNFALFWSLKPSIDNKLNLMNPKLLFDNFGLKVLKVFKGITISAIQYFPFEKVNSKNLKNLINNILLLSDQKVVEVLQRLISFSETTHLNNFLDDEVSKDEKFSSRLFIQETKEEEQFFFVLMNECLSRRINFIDLILQKVSYNIVHNSLIEDIMKMNFGFNSNLNLNFFDNLNINNNFSNNCSNKKIMFSFPEIIPFVFIGVFDRMLPKIRLTQSYCKIFIDKFLNYKKASFQNSNLSLSKVSSTSVPHNNNIRISGNNHNGHINHNDNKVHWHKHTASLDNSFSYSSNIKLDDNHQNQNYENENSLLLNENNSLELGESRNSLSNSSNNLLMKNNYNDTNKSVVTENNFRLNNRANKYAKGFFKRVLNDEQLINFVCQTLGVKKSMNDILTTSIPRLFVSIINRIDFENFEIPLNKKYYIVSDIDLSVDREFFYSYEVLNQVIHLVIGNNESIQNKEHLILKLRQIKNENVLNSLLIDIFSLIFLRKNTSNTNNNNRNTNSAFRKNSFHSSTSINNNLNSKYYASIPKLYEIMDILSDNFPEFKYFNAANEHIAFSNIQGSTELESAFVSKSQILNNLIKSNKLDLADSISRGNENYSKLVKLYKAMKLKEEIDDKISFSIEIYFSKNVIDDYLSCAVKQKNSQNGNKDDMKSKENDEFEYKNYYSKFTLNSIKIIFDKHSKFSDPVSLNSQNSSILIHSTTFNEYLNLYREFQKITQQSIDDRLSPAEIISILETKEGFLSIETLKTLLGPHAIEFILCYKKSINEKLIDLIGEVSQTTKMATIYQNIIYNNKNKSTIHHNNNENNNNNLFNLLNEIEKKSVFGHFLKKKMSNNLKNSKVCNEEDGSDDDFETVEFDAKMLIENSEKDLLNRINQNDFEEIFKLCFEKKDYDNMNYLYIRDPILFENTILENINKFTIKELLNIYPFCGKKTILTLSKIKAIEKIKDRNFEDIIELFLKNIKTSLRILHCNHTYNYNANQAINQFLTSNQNEDKVYNDLLNLVNDFKFTAQNIKAMVKKDKEIDISLFPEELIQKIDLGDEYYILNNNRSSIIFDEFSSQNSSLIYNQNNNNINLNLNDDFENLKKDIMENDQFLSDFVESIEKFRNKFIPNFENVFSLLNSFQINFLINTCCNKFFNKVEIINEMNEFYISNLLYRLSRCFEGIDILKFGMKTKTISNFANLGINSRFDKNYSLLDFNSIEFGLKMAELSFELDYTQEILDFCNAWYLDMTPFWLKKMIICFKMNMISVGKSKLPKIKNYNLTNSPKIKSPNSPKSFSSSSIKVSNFNLNNNSSSSNNNTSLGSSSNSSTLNAPNSNLEVNKLRKEIIRILSKEIIFDLSKPSKSDNEIQILQIVEKMKPFHVSCMEIYSKKKGVLIESEQINALHEIMMEINEFELLIEFYISSMNLLERALNVFNFVLSNNNINFNSISKTRVFNKRKDIFIKSLVYSAITSSNWNGFWLKIKKNLNEYKDLIEEMFKFLFVKKMYLTSIEIQRKLNLDNSDNRLLISYIYYYLEINSFNERQRVLNEMLNDKLLLSSMKNNLSNNINVLTIEKIKLSKEINQFFIDSSNLISFDKNLEILSNLLNLQNSSTSSPSVTNSNSNNNLNKLKAKSTKDQSSQNPNNNNNLSNNNSNDIYNSRFNSINTALLLLKNGNLHLPMQLVQLKYFSIDEICRDLLDILLKEGNIETLQKFLKKIESTQRSDEYEAFVMTLFKIIETVVVDQKSMKNFIDKTVRQDFKGLVFMQCGYIEEALSVAKRTHDNYLMNMVNDLAMQKGNKEILAESNKLLQAWAKKK